MNKSFIGIGTLLPSVITMAGLPRSGTGDVLHLCEEDPKHPIVTLHELGHYLFCLPGESKSDAWVIQTGACRISYRILARAAAGDLQTSHPEEIDAEKDASALKAGGSGYCCFIVTAAYGSCPAPRVQILRNFRDGTLAVFRLRRWFDEPAQLS